MVSDIRCWYYDVDYDYDTDIEERTPQCTHWIVSPKKIIGRQTKESVKTSRAPGWTVKERSTTKNDSDNYENNEN